MAGMVVAGGGLGDAKAALMTAARGWGADRRRRQEDRRLRRLREACRRSGDEWLHPCGDCNSWTRALCGPARGGGCRGGPNSGRAAVTSSAHSGTACARSVVETSARPCCAHSPRTSWRTRQVTPQWRSCGRQRSGPRSRGGYPRPCRASRSGAKLIGSDDTIRSRTIRPCQSLQRRQQPNDFGIVARLIEFPEQNQANLSL